jgi:DNA (cytosine-5)-methyltransferase 1
MKAATQKDLFQIANTAVRPGWFSSYLKKLHVSDESPGWPDRFGDELKKWGKKNLKRNIRTLSLFSGGGGLDIGFHDAGFNIVESVEIENIFSKTLEINSEKGKRLSGTKVICKDINDYHPEIENIEFIIGGPPCQTFSAAGARAAGVNGTDDDRGNLFLQYARIINKIQPKGFLFENVYRIVGAQSGRAWAKIQEAFEELGYTLYWRILDAADYGTPQFRERLIIVGLKNGQFLFPFPSHGPDSGDNREYYSAKSAISDLVYAGEEKVLSGRHGHLLNDIPPGLNYSFYTERMGHPNPIFAWRSKFSDYLYKAAPETPVRTIKAQGGQYTGPFSWENRPFTCEELKRLQTFPDDYLIHGNRQKIIHQLGNSVPPQFARVLALSILHQVFNEDIPAKIEYMSQNHQLGFRARKSELTDCYLEKAKKAISKIKPTKKILAAACGSEYFNIESDLRLIAKSREDESKYVATYEIKENSCRIHVSEANNKNSKTKYQIIISPPNTKSEHHVNAVLTTSSESPHGLLAVWKYFELIVKRNFSKDDLIQLFGYYQYKNQYKFEMEILDKKIKVDKFWNFISRITSGIFIGSITDNDLLCEEFECSPEELIDFLEIIKEVGYEIRNHNTNKQIKEGSVLMPYSFPTLNERSLQRLTRL